MSQHESTRARAVRSRTALLTAPVWSTLARLAVPGIVAMAIQSSMSIVETWYLGQLGTVALAGVALVFPILMLANMLSAGAVGGVVSGATAHAVGANDLPRAETVLRAALLIALFSGLVMAALFRLAGPAFYGLLGGEGAVLDAALAYSDALMPGVVLIWLFNMSAGVLRGSGDMVRPAVLQALVAASHFVLCRILILDLGLGIAGAAWAMSGAYVVGLAGLAALFLTGRSAVPLRRGSVSRQLVLPLLRHGTLAAFQAAMTIATALLVTAMVGRLGPTYLAGYGIGARLEFLMIPIIFGIGSALIAMVGANAGAGQRERAVGIGWRGALLAALIVGAIGLGSAAAPTAWASLFTSDPAILAASAAYMEIVAPCYVFFGLGLSLYFASQSLQTLGAPVTGSSLRLAIVVLGAALGSGSETAPNPDIVFGIVALAMASYGSVVALGLRFGPWRLPRRPRTA